MQTKWLIVITWFYLAFFERGTTFPETLDLSYRVNSELIEKCNCAYNEDRSEADLESHTLKIMTLSPAGFFADIFS